MFCLRLSSRRKICSSIKPSDNHQRFTHNPQLRSQINLISKFPVPLISKTSSNHQLQPQINSTSKCRVAPTSKTPMVSSCRGRCLIHKYQFNSLPRSKMLIWLLLQSRILPNWIIPIKWMKALVSKGHQAMSYLPKVRTRRIMKSTLRCVKSLKTMTSSK